MQSHLIFFSLREQLQSCTDFLFVDCSVFITSTVKLGIQSDDLGLQTGEDYFFGFTLDSFT